MIDRPARSKADLETIIDRHIKANKTDTALYQDALRERALLGTQHLSIERTVDRIREAARERRFITYGEVAIASGADFPKVRYQITEHLGDVVFWGIAHELDFMLTAIVVTKEHMTDGKMDEQTLNGFFSAAQRFRLAGEHERDRASSYLKEQQSLVFEWGSQGAPA